MNGADGGVGADSVLEVNALQEAEGFEAFYKLRNRQRESARRITNGQSIFTLLQATAV